MIPVWLVIVVLIGLPLAWVIGIITGYKLRELREVMKKSKGEVK